MATQMLSSCQVKVFNNAKFDLHNVSPVFLHVETHTHTATRKFYFYLFRLNNLVS